MTVLNVDNVNNKIRVKREQDGVLGTAHSSTSLITALNRAIKFKIGINTDIQTRVNVPYYFNPSESVAIGTASWSWNWINCHFHISCCWWWKNR